MEAFEARDASIVSQFQKVKEQIVQAVDNGWKKLIIPRCSVYPEVAEKLAEEGYNVVVVFGFNDSMSYNEITWEQATKGVKGKVIYVSGIDSDSDSECKSEVEPSANHFLQAFMHCIDGLSRPEF